jgi:hypothetical protein
MIGFVVTNNTRDLILISLHAKVPGVIGCPPLSINTTTPPVPFVGGPALTQDRKIHAPTTLELIGSIPHRRALT